MGFKDRQTISDIEQGKRKVKAQELLVLMSALNKPLEFFTDPFTLIGEKVEFSWRADAPESMLADFRNKASNWIGLFRGLRTETEDLLIEDCRLNLCEKSSFEDVENAAKTLLDNWDLGEVPSLTLPAAVEERLNALVLFIDAPHNISGAAYRLKDLSVILVNRTEAGTRRAFDLAHELFHILTWENIPPQKLEPQSSGRPRAEKLANKFAAELLMPESRIREMVGKNSISDTRITELAAHFRVSNQALCWKLYNHGLISKSRAESPPEFTAQNEKGSPPSFSSKFMRRIGRGIDEGKVSVGKVEEILGIDREQHEELYHLHKLEVPFDL